MAPEIRASDPVEIWCRLLLFGWHNDAAFMGNVRADYSFTIAINSSDEYEGGHLRLKTPQGLKEVRLKQGQGIVYSTGLLHEVAEVTAGERFVMIGCGIAHPGSAAQGSAQHAGRHTQYRIGRKRAIRDLHQCLQGLGGSATVVDRLTADAIHCVNRAWLSRSNKEENGAEGQIRTADTRIFNPGCQARCVNAVC